MRVLHLFFDYFLSNLMCKDDELFHDGLDDFVGLIIIKVDFLAEIAHHNYFCQFFLIKLFVDNVPIS